MSTSALRNTAHADWKDPTRAVVVGVDGSERNAAAIEYGVAMATATGRPLTLLAVLDDYSVPIPHYSTRTDGSHDWKVLDRIADEVQAQNPGLTVRRELQTGDTVNSLLDRSVEQGVLVVGKRGLGTFGRLLLGSTSVGVAGRSRVPIVVVPDGWRQPDHQQQAVVVGVSVDDDPDPALHYGFAAASARSVAVRVVHVLDIEPLLVFDASVGGPTYEHWEERDREAVEAAVEHVRAEFSGVECVLKQRRGRASAALLEESASAQLIVLGRHHNGRFGFGLGSVARDVLHHAEVPVAVIPSA